MIKGSIEKHTLNWLKRNVHDVSSNISTKEQSDIIYGLLVGVPAPVVIIEESGDNYSLLSGNDLITSLKNFINGNITIESNSLFELEDSSFKGKTFFDFSDVEKEKFLEVEVMVNILRPLTENQRNIIVNLTKTKVANNEKRQIVCEADHILEGVLKHKFFEYVNIPNISIDVVAQILMFNENGAVSELRSVDIIEFKKALKKKDICIDKELDFLGKAYTEKTSYLKKTHLPMIVQCARRAMKDGVKPDKFKSLMDNFFNDIPGDYKKAADSTSSRSKANVRLKVLTQYYENNK